jgi:hypothetical protein
MDSKSTDSEDIKDVMKCLGEISGKLEGMEKASTRTTFALIGIIAAQIGVKVLGTPILLDIATVLAIVGLFVLLGALLLKIRIRRGGKDLTVTGKLLVLMILAISATQVAVYFRDLGLMDANIIYCIRIFQNISILVFAWKMITDHRIFKGEL